MSTRVAFVFPPGPDRIGGAERQTLLFLERVDPGRLEVELVLLGPNPAFAGAARGLDVPVTVLSNSAEGERRLGTWRALRRHVRTRAPLVLEFFGLRTDVGARLALLGVAGVVHLSAVRGIETHRAAWQTRLARWTARRVDAWVANSRAGLQHAIEREGARPEDSHVVPNGVLLPPEPVVRGDRAKYGWSDGDLVAVLVANHRPMKRQEDLVRAVAVLRERGHRVRALLVGQETKYTERVLRLARDAKVQDDVVSVGFTTDVWPHLAIADVLVVCSEQEGLPGSILEGMVAGLPVVASRVGGVPELLEPERDGLLYEAGDVDTLAAHLERLATDASLRERWGAAGRRKGIERFGVDAMVERLTATLEDAGRRVPSSQRTGTSTRRS